ncbi:ABC transporter substrate-binding protein [Methanobrevibacter sp.]|uniref:ABC transporter substrate-binding protein n=1 Tax=Methanobrevibacter sp. TaxID=66852 RepID=UPI0026DF8AC0|nr:ABC transporter substrate-binding protein [Methanobrevibacter sp.]MDO5823660.1 ABC transporter substrate-binding protein [Methanobrevibacter sp.]
MEKKYIIYAVVAVIAIAGIAVVALNGGNTERAENELVTCVAAHGEEPEYGFDPMHGWGYHDSGTEPLIQSTLLKRDKDNNFVNDLATDYEISSDLKTYTVTIRDDVNFTDGSKLTADDVVFSYTKAKELGEGADLGSMKEVKSDGNKVIFTLDKKDSTFINKLTDVGIVPEASYNEESYGQNPIGSGPYKLAQWDKGQQYILEKNHDYYGKEPYFEKITNLFLDQDAAFAAVKNGDVDIAEVPVAYANETVDGYHLEYFDSVDVRGISLPTQMDEGKLSPNNVSIGNNVTGDPAIRQALSVGINREQVFEGSLNGFGNVSYNGVANQLAWASEPTFKDGNIEEAKSILSAAGWKDTDGDGIVEKDGQKASFNIHYSSAKERQAIAVAVAEQAKEFGIEIIPQGGSWDDIERNAYSQGVVWGFGSADPYAIAHQYDSRLAGMGYDNPEYLNDSAVDSLVDKALELDLNSSYSTWSQASQQANTNNPYLWIGTMTYTYFVSDSLNISNSTQLIFPHGGDIWGNIYDWNRINETAEA